jgi:hypothetical protein
VALPQGAHGSLTDCGEGFWQKRIKIFALCQALSKFLSLCAKFLIAHGEGLGLPRIHFCSNLF